MATTYAALISLIHVINRIQHPSCPVLFQDKSQIQSVFDKVSFLIDFLEENDALRRLKVRKSLWRRVARAAYVAEDLIESFVVQQILEKSSGQLHFIDFLPEVIREIHFIKKRVRKNEKMKRDQASELFRKAYELFCLDLDKTIHELNCMMEEVIKIGDGEVKEDHMPILRVGSILPSGGKNCMVGFDDDLISLMEMLTTYQSSHQIIPLVGMGGTGKTTLAINVFKNPFIMNHFDVQAWVTISQEYSKRETILCLLHGITDPNEKAQMDTEELGERLYKCLYGRKYLITLDDIWSVEAWDEIKRFFPDNGNGSRVLLTTRLLNVANCIGTCNPYQMRFLDYDKSWDLLSNIVFGQEDCPLELEKVGKKICKSCKGLPLAIVVIGGLLKVSRKTREYWINVLENITSVVNAENEGTCLKILALSYTCLPIHIKPCFLYMSIFKEDSVIRTSRLIKLWVAEGFLKPNLDKTLEEVGFEHLNDLVDRNLIMVGKLGSSGKMKTVIIHDLLLDLCSKKAQKDGFLCVTKKNTLSLQQRRKGERHQVINHHVSGTDFPISARSLIFNFSASVFLSPFPRSCMLRILVGRHDYSLSDGVKLVNSRYMEFEGLRLWSVSVSSFSISLLWNLETLIVDTNLIGTDTLPPEIWSLTHLRHLIFPGKVILPDPVFVQIGGENSYILNNLQTLSTISNFSCSDEVLSIIPNLKKLGICYGEESRSLEYVSLTRRFNNLLRLQKLEVLICKFKWNLHDKCVFHEVETLSLPRSLRSLTLSHSSIPSQNMTIIGSLPNLEVLKLETYAFSGQEWSPVEGEFESLKYLSMTECHLVIWNADNLNFPKLQCLKLEKMYDLKEIPKGIGDIASLESIVMRRCLKPVVISAKKLQEEQQNLGNDDILVQAFVYPDSLKQKLQNLADDQFQIIGIDEWD